MSFVSMSVSLTEFFAALKSTNQSVAQLVIKFKSLFKVTAAVFNNFIQTCVVCEQSYRCTKFIH